MQGLHANIYKSGRYDCSNGGVSSTADEVTIVNIGIDLFDADDKHPAVILERGPYNTVRAVPKHLKDAGKHTMFGGAYIGTSDGRFSKAVEALLGHGFYGAIPLHDRVE